jgi:hypothetical protein
MGEYPRTLSGEAISAELRSVIDSLTSRLLSGTHPAHSVLRDQYSRARIRNVELTGAGFFANFEVPTDAPVVEPARLMGGDVHIEVDGLAGGAGSLLCVSEGRLAFLEVYVNSGEPWSEHTVVLDFGEVVPIPGSTAPSLKPRR